MISHSTAANPLAPLARVTPEVVREVLAHLYGISGEDVEVVPLPGEHDSNFRVTEGDRRYVLKVHPPMAPAAGLGEIDLQNRALLHLASRDPSLPVPRPVPTADGEVIAWLTLDDGTERAVRLLTWLPGRPWGSFGAVGAPGPATFASLGRFLARMDRAFASFEHPRMRRPHRWAMQTAADLQPRLGLVADPAGRALAGRVLARFAEEVLPRLATCPAQVIHGDASDHNVLMGEDDQVSGLIDFGDMGPRPAGLEPRRGRRLRHDRPGPAARRHSPPGRRLRRRSPADRSRARPPLGPRAHPARHEHRHCRLAALGSPGQRLPPHQPGGGLGAPAAPRRPEPPPCPLHPAGRLRP